MIRLFDTNATRRSSRKGGLGAPLNASKVVVRLFSVALSTLLALSMCGCADSDTITQLIFENSPDLPYDDSHSEMLNDPNAIDLTTSLPQLQVDPTQKEKQNTEQNVPEEGEDQSPEQASQTVDSNTSTNSTQDKNNTNSSNNTNASNTATENTNTESNTPSGNPSDNTNTNDNANSNSGEGDQEYEKGRGKEERNTGGNEMKIYTDYGDFPEIPTGVTRVAAVGQAAVIVSMLGGTSTSTPLVATDAELLGNADALKYLANKGFNSDNVMSLWSGDGTQEGSLSDENLTMLINNAKADPDLVFVMEGDDTLTAEQKQKLLDENIIVYDLPNMSSAAKIKTAVSIVGQILAEGGNTAAGQLANDYISYHDGIVDAYKNKNGGVTGGYNYDSNTSAASFASAMSTVYISDWDYDAVYNDSNGYLTTAGTGVGIADVGYADHPVSYYMSVGGANNTASSGDFREMASGSSSVVWQFSLSQAPVTWGYWTRIDRSKATYELDGGSFDKALLSSRSTEDGANNGANLGSDTYPGVVVADQRMATSMAAAAALQNGIYHAYPLTSRSGGGVISMSGVGFDTGSNLVYSAIGAATVGGVTVSLLNDGAGNIKDYGIYVNPGNAFSDWAAGSVESVLEVPWIYAKFRDTGDAAYSDAEKYVREFYQKFYGYTFADGDDENLADIMDGRSGE